MRKSLVAATLVASSLLAGRSNAAINTYTYDVTGGTFTTSSGTAPFASITESLTITFDTSAAVSQATAGIVQNASSTIAPTSTLAYTYVPGIDQLLIGGLAATVGSSDPASTDFALVIGNATLPAYTVTSLSYSTGAGAVYSAQTLGVTATPEPASLAVIGSTLAFVALIRRRR